MTEYVATRYSPSISAEYLTHHPQMVPCSGSHAYLQRVYESHRRMERWVRLGRNAKWKALVPWEGLYVLPPLRSHASLTE